MLAHLLALTSAGVVLASPPARPVRLQYASTPAVGDCPAEQELRALVSARLGYDPFTGQAQLTARVRIAPRDGHLTGTLELVDETSALVGSRTVDAHRNECGLLAETLALALAIAIDPQAGMGRPSRPEPDVNEPGPVQETAPPMPRQELARSPEPPPPREETAQLALLGGGSASLGLLPAPALGGTVELDVRRQNLSLQLDGTFFPYVRLESLGGQVDTSLSLAGIAGCGWIGPGAACLRATGGVFQATGTAYPGNRGGLLMAANLGVALALQWRPDSKWLLKVRLGASLPLLRSAILVGTTRIWEVANVPLDGSLLVGWVLP